MNVLRSVLVTMLLLAAFSVQAACTWPAWEQFKKDYISQEGRVIDPSDARKITTSEGQSYGMFSALAANDRAAFDNILDWTQNNLAQGSLKERLPAWLWGKEENSKWEVLDSNSASDGDVWMAWSLLEAGRLWKEQRYTDIGSALLKRIAREEVVHSSRTMPTTSRHVTSSRSPTFSSGRCLPSSSPSSAHGASSMLV